MSRIERFYNQNPEKEWERLKESAYDTIESEITKRFLLKYLEKIPDSPITIADVGCGPGHYSLWLLDNGYDVLMCDLSQGLLDLASKKLAKNKMATSTAHGKLLGMIRADATDLSGIESNSFNVTLLFGPLYHLLEAAKRQQAVEEALRITKPGGLIFSATINRLCPFLAMLHREPDFLISELTDDTEEIDRILAEGKYENVDETPGQFTDAYFANPTEIPELYKKLGVEHIETFACEGIASYIGKSADVLYENKKAWSKFLDIVYANATRPEILGISEHVVFIGKKPIK